MQTEPTSRGPGVPDDAAPNERIRFAVPRSRRALIWELCRRQLRWIVFAMVVAVVGLVGVTALSANALRDFVDAVVDQSRPIGPLAVRLIVLAALLSFFTFVLNQTINRILYHLEFELRIWLYQGLQAKDPRQLDSVATGQMITRSMSDLELMKGFILLIPYLVGYGMVLLGLSIYLIFQSAPLTAVAVAAIPANILIILRMRKRMWGLSWIHLNRRAEVTTVFDEAVRGIRVVKAFGREDEERRRLKVAADPAYGVAIARTRLLAKFDLLLKVLPVALNAAMLFLAGRLIVSGTITIGILVVFLRYAREFNSFARGLDYFVDIWQYAKAAAGRIVELISFVDERGPSARTGSVSELPPQSTGLRIEGVDVSFAGRRVLEGLTADVPPGSLVVVQGGPRSGKSTVAGVASGDIPAQSGTVTLDGVGIQDLDRRTARSAVRVVSEDSFLFGRTLRENLLMGALASDDAAAADDRRLQAALHAAGADSVVAELAGGLDTVLGDRGLTLSGGQRQRIALARALVAVPRLLVLDDALLAVNPSLEMDILRRIRDYAPDMAILCLTRRDGPAAVADAVVQLPGPRAAGTTDDTEPASVHPGDVPAEADLASIVASLPPDTDRPSIDESTARASDEVPGIRSVLKPFGWRVLQASGLLLVLTTFELIPNGLFRTAIDAIERGSSQTSDRMALGILAAGGVIAVLAYLLRIWRKRVEEGVVYLLRRRTFQRLTRLGVEYYDRELPGYVAARVVYDLDRIAEFMDNAPFQIFSSLTLLVLTFAVIVVWSPPIALVGALFVPLLIFVSWVYLPIADRAYQRTRAAVGEAVARLQEDFAGRHVINGLRAQSVSEDAFWGLALRLRRAQMWSQGVSVAYAAVIEFLLELAAALVLWRAGNLVAAGVLSAGAMISLRLYIDSALAPIPRLAFAFRQYMVAKASFRTLQEPFRVPILPPDRPDAVPCPPLAGELVLRDVSFTYPGTERTVLRDVTLEIAPGDVVAVVGPTGAGKSSIAKLVGRIYDPDSGTVLADGVDVRTYDLHTYRRRLGIVPQDAFCFRGTVASNIAYGRPDAARHEIESAARAVGAYDALATLDGGLDAVVEEEGRNLTAAQRQLVALARAWLVNPDVLVLDEATSTLDGHLEEGVLDAVRRLGCTTVLVTHRLHVAKRADWIAVVDAGRIAEAGRHEELIEARGAYARLWSLGPEIDLHGTIRGSEDEAVAEPAAPAD